MEKVSDKRRPCVGTKLFILQRSLINVKPVENLSIGEEFVYIGLSKLIHIERFIKMLCFLNVYMSFLSFLQIVYVEYSRSNPSRIQTVGMRVLWQRFSPERQL